MTGLESPVAGAGGARQIPEWSGIISEAHQRQPSESPDPFGAYDADWEWQGRYLELEQKLLAQARRQGRPYFQIQGGLTRGQHNERRQCAEPDRRSSRKTRFASSSRGRTRPRATKRRGARLQRRAR